MGLFSIFLGFWCQNFFKKLAQKEEEILGLAVSGYHFPRFMGLFFFCIFGFIVFMINLVDLLEIIVAPKIYLLEYAAQIYKASH